MQETPNRPHSRNRRTLWLVVGLLLVATGGLLLKTDIEQFREVRNRRHWPTVTGRITASSVVGERAFRPNLIYQYLVDSALFTDSSFLDMPSFGGRRSRYDAAEKKASEYPVGAEVPVHYNPDNPGESRLKVTAPWSIYGQVGFSGFLIVLGLIAGMAGFRTQNAPVRQV
jgi:hypothetical protein